MGGTQTTVVNTLVFQLIVSLWNVDADFITIIIIQYFWIQLYNNLTISYIENKNNGLAGKVNEAAILGMFTCQPKAIFDFSLRLKWQRQEMKTRIVF